MPDTLELIKDRINELRQSRTDLSAQIRDTQAQLDQIEKELEYLEGYPGLKVEKEKPARAVRATGAKRGPRGERQQQLYDLVRENPGITALEIIERLGASDKEGAAIRSALFNMKKDRRLEVGGRGRYVAVPQEG